MKLKPEMRCCICHEVIQTQHVFSENDQVYVKKSSTEECNGNSLEEAWSPINFQWVPDMNVRNSLMYHIASSNNKF